MKHLVIIGAGNLGRELFWHVQLSKGYGTEFDVKGYLDDTDPSDEKLKKVQRPLLGKVDEYRVEKDDVFICAIGTPSGREDAIAKMLNKGAEFINLIHNSAIIQGEVSLGKGIFIGPFTVIGDHVSMGNHTMLNTHSAVGHDAVIGDYTCIMSYVDVTGNCQIGKRVFLGSGCRMVPHARIENDAYIGIGSVVLRHVKEGHKVFGNPAKAYDI